MFKTFLRCAVPSLSFLLPSVMLAQAASHCGAPPIVSATSLPNLFNIDQERWLGEAERDEMESGTEMVSDTTLNDHLQAIVDRLAKNLPQPHVPFRVVLYESSEVNGFSIAGGSIYISRKLASVTHNDDELAAVLGHEMGHIASHQFAFEMTNEFHRLLHVSELGDRKDVYSKYQQLYDAEMTDKHPPSQSEDAGQDEADRVGVYLVAAAGYRPQAFAEFWDRTQFVQGKTGSRWTDFFRMTKPGQKRLRGMQAMIAALPAGCAGTGSTSEEQVAFGAWQKRVIANQKAAPTAQTARVKLEDPLQMELEQVRFSADGKMLLAQDESSIYLIDRQAMQVKTRIDADRAQAANFMPDGTGITFTTPGLHTERWSIDGKLIEAHEPLAQHTCLQTKLSPDGRTIVCMTFDEEKWQTGISLLDSASGDVLFENKNFFVPNLSFMMSIATARNEFDLGQIILSSTSSDGNYIVIGPGGLKLAFDFRTRTPIKLTGALKYSLDGGYAFVGSNRIAGAGYFDPGSAGIFSFPDGKRLKPLKSSLGNLESVTAPGDRDMVRSNSLWGKTVDPKDEKKKDAKDVARFDLRETLVDFDMGQFLVGSKSSALDYWNGFAATQSRTGDLEVVRLDGGAATDPHTMKLPISPLGELFAVAMSPDGKFLAYSTRDRGAVWDAGSGKRLALVQPFASVVWPDSATMVADFEKSDKGDRSLVRFDLKAHSSQRLKDELLNDPKDFERMQNGFFTEWKQEKGKARTLVIHSFADGSTLWSKTFSEGVPWWTITEGRSNLIFGYPVLSDTAKKACKEDSALAAEAAMVKKKEYGRLIEVVDPKTGTTVSKTVLEMPADYTGTSGLNQLKDVLLVTGHDNRTLAYSTKDAKQLWRVFGWVTAVDEASGRVAVWNRSNEVIVFDTAGRELLHKQLGDKIRFAMFEDAGAKLVVLTSDQSVQTLDVSAAVLTAEAAK